MAYFKVLIQHLPRGAEKGHISRFSFEF